MTVLRATHWQQQTLRIYSIGTNNVATVSEHCIQTQLSFAFGTKEKGTKRMKTEDFSTYLLLLSPMPSPNRTPRSLLIRIFEVLLCHIKHFVQNYLFKIFANVYIKLALTTRWCVHGGPLFDRVYVWIIFKSRSRIGFVSNPVGRQIKITFCKTSFRRWYSSPVWKKCTS